MPLPNILIIGSSTGGPKILEEMFSRLPVLNAAVIIVQHITPLIDRAFVSSLARFSQMPVTLAADGQLIQSGQVIVAPGGVHFSLVGNQKVRLFNGERVNSVCPAIDVAMKSIHSHQGKRLVGVILTGMGCDGSEGIVHLKQIGAVTLAQDQKTSVIYGMPKAAADTGKIDFILPTFKLVEKISTLFP